MMVMPSDGVSDQHPYGWYPKDHQAALVRCAKSCTASGAAVEIGCWDGQSAELLAYEFGHLICVDPWRDEGADRAYKRFLENMKYLDVVRFRCGWEEFVKVFDGPLAFAHIDAVHEREPVRDNIQAFLPLLNPGGVLCGHDANNPLHPHVLAGVYDALPEAEVTVDDWVWSWRKP